MATFPNLERLRKRAGFAKAELSRLANVSRELIAKAEEGEQCSSHKLHLLLNALNHKFYNEQGEPLDPAVEIKE